MKKLLTKMNLLAASLVVLGSFLVINGGNIRVGNAVVNSQPSLVNPEVNLTQDFSSSVVSGNPVSISIPELGINNSVINGRYNKDLNQWTLTEASVQFATNTYKPNNERGLTFMYGHNNKQVFSKLHLSNEDTKVKVVTDNGHSFYYKFKASRKTNPEDISVFAYDGPPILVLQTCIGLFYQDRLLVTFEFIGLNDD